MLDGKSKLKKRVEVCYEINSHNVVSGVLKKQIQKWSKERTDPQKAEKTPPPPFAIEAPDVREKKSKLEIHPIATDPEGYTPPEEQTKTEPKIGEREDLVEAVNTTQRSKPTLGYLNNKMEEFESRERIKFLGTTHVHDPAMVTKEQAWSQVPVMLQQIHEVLERIKSVSFVLTVVEMHTGGKVSRCTKDGKKKSKREIGPEYDKQKSDELRRKRVNRDKLEDEERTKGREEIEIEKLLIKYDQENGFVTTSDKLENGRTLVLDEQTGFPIIWGAQEDPAKEPRYYVVKKKDPRVDNTLVGYPHVHGVIGYTAATGEYPPVGFFKEKLYGIYEDTRAGARKKNKMKGGEDSGAAVIAYVLKNTRHKAVYEELKKVGAENCMSVLNFAGSSEGVRKFFRELLVKSNGGVYYKMVESWKDNVVGENGGEVKKVKPEAQKLKADTVLSRAISKLGELMRYNNLAMSEGVVYQKLEGTKMTWGVWEYGKEHAGKAASLLSLLSTEKNEEFITQGERLVKLMEEPCQIRLPTVEIDCQWVEYADCFMFLGEGVVVKRNEKYACFKYYPEYKWEQIARGVSPPKEFMKVVDNSIQDEKTKRELLVKMYKLLLPRVTKERVIFMVGDSNSGKTTLVDVVSGVLPQNRVCVLTNSEFALSGVVGKLLLLIDELAGIKSCDGATFLKILEGNCLMGLNEKFKTPRTAKMYQNIVLISNEDRMDEEAGKRSITMDALDKRIQRYHFKELKDATPEGKGRVMEEEANVLLYLAQHYYETEGKGLKLNLSEEEVDVMCKNYKKKHPHLYASKPNLVTEIPY